MSRWVGASFGTLTVTTVANNSGKSKTKDFQALPGGLVYSNQEAPFAPVDTAVNVGAGVYVNGVERCRTGTQFTW
jgi:hypothetical protein